MLADQIVYILKIDVFYPSLQLNVMQDTTSLLLQPLRLLRSVLPWRASHVL